MRTFLRGILAASSQFFVMLPSHAAALTPAEAEAIAEEAYIYGYSLITTEVTRVQMTNVAKGDDTHAPMGQFINVKRYPPADYRG